MQDFSKAMLKQIFEYNRRCEVWQDPVNGQKNWENPVKMFRWLQKNVRIWQGFRKENEGTDTLNRHGKEGPKPAVQPKADGAGTEEEAGSGISSAEQ